ncbi:hypothetical protein [Streptomyces sp. NPDC001678]|uniref:hypothetical protein n=1 Tax=Streptomyces sp. NPDC001678 TaxID=3364599 RepID=UPI0036ADA654
MAALMADVALPLMARRPRPWLRLMDRHSDETGLAGQPAGLETLLHPRLGVGDDLLGVKQDATKSPVNMRGSTPVSVGSVEVHGLIRFSPE